MISLLAGLHVFKNLYGGCWGLGPDSINDA